MSIAAVQSRIAAIQSQLASLRTAQTSIGSPVGTTATQFADQLLSAVNATSGSSAAGTGYTTSAGAPNATAEAVIAEAKKYVGMPYVWGGSSPAQGGMDCSGLMQYAYGQVGIDLPRVSADQARSGTSVASLAEAQPGDLVAWDNSSRNNGADHIAMYLGNNMILEAPRTGLDIRIISLDDAGHGAPDYIRRVIPSGGYSPAAATGPITPGDTSTGGSVTAGRVSGVPYADTFNAVGAKYGISPAVLSAVAKQESGYNARAVSPAGAQGLMQFMPATARGLGVDPFDPVSAIDGAARYLKQNLNQFGTIELALAAYNAGPGNVSRYNGIPPFSETQNYVRSIMASLR